MARTHFSALLLLLVVSSYAQAPINILSIQQGLPKSQIYDIVQDSFGFIWLGTRDGLVKYDGHEVKVLRKGFGELPFNYCYDLFIDQSHHLWMASNADYQGVARMNLQTQEVTHLHSVNLAGLPNNGVVAIKQTSNGEMIFATKDFQLTIYDWQGADASTFDLNKYLPPGSARVIDVTDLFCDPLFSDVYWLCCREGLARFDAAKEELDFIPGRRWRPVRFYFDDGTSPFLWISLEGEGGLLRMNLENTIERIFYGLNGTRSENDFVRSNPSLRLNVDHMARKSATQFYLATGDHGLGIFDLNSGTFNFTQHHSPLLESDLVRAIYANPNGEVWISSDKNGLFYMRPQIEQFTARFFPELVNDNSAFGLSSILDLGRDQYLLTLDQTPFIWIWDRAQDIFNRVTLDFPYHYAARSVPWEEKIMIGANRGFYALDTERLSVEYDPWQINAGLKNINHLVKEDSTLWFIDWGNGIGKYDGRLTRIPGNTEDGLRHGWTHDLALGPDDRIWVGQENGLYALNKHSLAIETLAHQGALNGFGNPNFKAVTFDHFDRLWTGNFGAGIFCFDIFDKFIVRAISTQDGLPSDRIYDLFTDRDGHIWVWTSEGLSSFQPEADPHSITLQNYPDTKYIKVGRTGVWFYQVESGEIFLGMDGGFVHFDPRTLRAQGAQVTSAPLVSEIRIFDEPIPIEINRSSEHPIRLKPNQNFISFAFSAPQSGFISQQEFNYQLEGVDVDWVNSGSFRKASYTDLDPGTYFFRTRVRTENGIWSESSSPIAIEIGTPWYQTLWAKFLWGLLGGAFLLGVNRLFVIRERMRSQLALRRAEANNLRELDQAKSQFFTQISHEFRTPLTIILGMAEKIRNGTSAQLLQDGMRAIERNGQLLLQQINHILDLSKLQSKTIQLNMVNGDIIPYLEYLIESYVFFAREKGILIRRIFPPEKIIMDYDPDRLRDVFMNLMSNALKFTPSGGQIVVEVNRLHDKDEETLVWSVADSGPGIAATEVDKIFEPYYQAGDHHRGGSGLGLATARQWVLAMGGKIDIESVKDRGTKFLVTLPISQEATLSLAAMPTNALPTVDGEVIEIPILDQTVSKGLVLVIEDNMDVLNYLRLCLTDYSVIHAPDGELGVAKAQEVVPDLIISDIMMPKKDGYEVCALVRANELTNHIPIILLTAKATDHERKQGLQLGADAYLTKPFDQEELLIRVQGLLSQRILLQEKYQSRTLIDEDVKHNALEDAFLDSIEKYTMEHLSHDFSIEELAGHLKISRVQLYRKVKALTGKSPTRYVRLIRLLQARKMLGNTAKNVNEVCYAVGFSDPSYFAKVFKEAFGQPPSTFRTTI